MSIYLLLIIILLLVLAIIFIFFSDTYKSGKGFNDSRNKIKTKIELSISEDTTYRIDQVLDIEKVVKSGIYLLHLKNPNDDRDMFYYVGQAKDIRSRFLTHRREILNNSTKGTYGKMIEFANKREIYGYVNLVNFSILEFCPESELTVNESKWIENFDARYSGNTQKATRREDFVIREEGNIKLIESLKLAEIKKVNISVEIITAKLNSGANSYRRSDDKNVVKFKKGDYAFTGDKIDNINRLVIDGDADISYDERKISIHNISNESLSALVEISREQEKQD